MTANLILWLSMIWLPWLMYFMLKNEMKPKKNIVVGITLPFAGQQDPQVQQLLQRFQWELKRVTWLLTLCAAVGLFLPGLGLSMTVWMLWILAVCLVPNVPYVRCNRALRLLKEQRGWKRQGGLRPAADLAALAEELKWLSPLYFLPPLLISLVPVLFDRELWFLWFIMSASVVLFYVCYRWCYRNKAEMVDGNTERTLALTRIRRYNWGKAWLIMAWATGLLNPLIWLTLDHIWWNMAVFLTYTVLIVWTALGIEFRVRALQEKLSESSGQDFYVDEDDHWIWGLFYYNPHDVRLMINARVGMNSTINLARPAGKVLMAILVLILAAMPLTGVWLMGMEREPVELTVTETQLRAAHFHKEYILELEDVEKAELVEQLPAMTRVAGTAMPSAYTGKWNAQEWGRFNCCVDPREGPWLLVETADGTRYLFGGGENGTAEQAVLALTE